MSDLSEEDAAHAVVWFMDTRAKQPGNFMENIIRAGLKADWDNLIRIRRAWPNVGLAIHLYKNVPGGYATLRMRAGLPPEGEDGDA